MHCASNVDLQEAYDAGYSALEFARDGMSGYMVGIKRDSNSPYKVSYFLVPADKIANNVKYFPTEWVNKAGNHLTEEALNYFAPLVNGEPSLILENYLPKFKSFNNPKNK